MIRPLIVAVAMLFCSNLCAAAKVDKPNIILIFVDDMGYGDPGCYGGKEIPTPNIDRLADGGVRCTDGYVTAPVCGPSRLGLLTGAYQQRFGCYWNNDLWPKYGLKLPPNHLLMPQALKTGGYVTGHVGKWNITEEAKPYVDEAYDVMCWKGAYFPDEQGNYLGVNGPGFSTEKHGWGPERPGDEYLTDRLTRDAIGFVERHAQEPFFLYLAYNAPHTPLEAKRSYQQQFRQLKDEPNRLYAAMVASLDEDVGKLLDRLGELGIERNTLIAFVSDNGPAKGWTKLSAWRKEWPKETLLGSAGPLAGHKAQLQEGGIREPFILYWPGHLEAGSVYRRPVSTLDLYPTFCAAAGVKVPQATRLDGVNLLPYLRGETAGDPHQMLMWKTHNAGSLREGDWKFVLEPWGKKRLINLADDLAETRDVAAKNPEKFKQLEQAWLEWSKSFPPPVSGKDKPKKK